MRVMIVAAHPDDAELGMGATIAQYVAERNQVSVYCLSNGVGSRGNLTEAAIARGVAAHAAAKVLGCETFIGILPDQKFDTIPLLEIVQSIEHKARLFQPDIVYTHWHGDINQDHAITARATLTAFRPVPGSTVRALYGFEVPGSTEWGTIPFVPSHYEQVVPATMAKKIEALQCYADEMRPYPHPRSFDHVGNLAAIRGSAAGMENAEAFHIYRQIRR